MISVLGIDQSSRKLAWFCLSLDENLELSERITYGKLEVPQETMQQRIHMMHNYLVDVIGNNKPHLLVCETPVVGRGGAHATIVQAQVVGSILLTSILCGVDATDVVHPGTWKKNVVGNGRSTKDDVSAWIRDNYPEIWSYADTDQDLLDASCIALYGIDLVRKEQLILGGGSGEHQGTS